MAFIKIDYEVSGTDQIRQADTAIEDLNKSTEEATEKSEDLSKKTQDTSKEMDNLKGSLKDTANNIQVLGVGLGDATTKLRGATTGVKLFSTAMKAIPIVALVAALGSLVAFFTKTERGAQKLRVITAALGAAFGAITDVVIKFGEALFNKVGEILTTVSEKVGSFINLLKDLIPGFDNAITKVQSLTEGFGGLGKEIIEDAKAAAELERRLNDVIVQERNLAVARAEANAEIERQKLLAEDVTKTLGERQAAAETALRLERGLLQQEIALQRERVAIIEQQNALSESSEEDIQALADARIVLAQLEQASTTKQIELNNKLNMIIKERKAAYDEEIAILEELASKTVETDTLITDTEIENNNKLLEARLQGNIEEFKADQAKAKEKQALAEAEQENLIGTAKLGASLAGQTGNFNKAQSIVQATIDTYAGASKALANLPPPLSFIAAAATIAAGLRNVTTIASQNVPQGQIQIPNFKSGKEKKFKDGVINLDGPGTGTSDSIPAWLSKGESVMTAKETAEFMPTLRAIRKGEIDPELLNGLATKGPRVIDNSKVIEVPRDRFTIDEEGFKARLISGASETVLKSNRFSW